jgi:hypothetical protein
VQGLVGSTLVLPRISTTEGARRSYDGLTASVCHRDGSGLTVTVNHRDPELGVGSIDSGCIRA